MTQVDPGTPSSPSATDATPQDETQKGKLFATLCYACNFICIPFWIIPLVMRDNAFSLYHAKQCLGLFLFVIVAAVISAILTFLCIGFPMLIALAAGSVVLNIIGLINVSNGRMKPLPLLGRFFEKWFSGIGKQSPKAAH